jgi:hypothetical protein
MFTEDLAAFFDTADHSITALVGATSVNGIFDEPSRDDVLVGSTRPTFMCATAKLPAGYKTATIVINGRSFKVSGAPDVDETGGITTLELEEQ